MRMSSDRQIIVLFQEIGSLNLMAGHVRIMIGSAEIAVCTHAQYKMTNNSPEQLHGATSCGFEVAMPRNCHLV